MSDFGYSQTGRKKLKGFYGPLMTPQGNISTELSTTVDWGEGEIEIPLLVPGLKRKHIQYLLSGNKPNQEIMDIAIEHAKKRIEEGLNPFAQEDEQLIDIPKEE